MDKTLQEAELRAGWGLVVVRGTSFLAAVAVLWLLLGVVVAVDIPSWVEFVVGGVLFVTLMFGPVFAMMKISEDVPWALWALLPFLVALGGTAIALPGDHYLRTFGEQVTATVVDREWVEGRKRRDDHYRYVLHDPDGRPLVDDHTTSGDPLEVGETVEMLVDPLGVVEPRPPASQGVMETATWISGGWIALMTVVLSVMGERRRRRMRPKRPGGSGRSDDSDYSDDSDDSGWSSDSDGGSGDSGDSGGGSSDSGGGSGD
ncbi:putative membrane protein YgcG [Streptosporangium becharense]|uniref:Putative membrane protein YgcG n=1 Tax=Streptosporangium becharense TaxID=1816182 RepID=A0A7W9IHR5_9ACTN|nr:hypothetical protein [Streptosporangium becharense]MBB2912515.1 putative membrane protein YgcG [Streptosporangium becharense]MBB5820655.1 putative membrane protein YgcG [Streptosporangium becharense]